MAGRVCACLRPPSCRRFYPDERYTPPTGDCGRTQAVASPATTWSCPRAHSRSFRLRISSPIGQSPAPNPPGWASIRSGRPPRNHPPCSGAADPPLPPSRASRPLLRAHHLAGRLRRPASARGRTDQPRPRRPRAPLRRPRRSGQRHRRGPGSRRHRRVRRLAGPDRRSAPVVAAAPRGGRPDGPGPGAGGPAQGAGGPAGPAGHGPRHRLLPLRPHGHRVRRLRRGDPAPPPLAARRPRAPRARRRLRRRQPRRRLGPWSGAATTGHWTSWPAGACARCC